MHTLTTIEQPADIAGEGHLTRFVAKSKQLLPGLALALAIAVVSIEAGKLDWLQENGIGALTLAIVLGIVVGNTFYARIAVASEGGVAFSKQNLLRLGIVLYGFRLTFQDVAQVGLSGIVIDALVLTSTIGLGVVLGTKVFKLDRDTALLIGAGSGICGAAAVMASAPVLRARAEQVAIAVSTVVVFGTAAIFLYPLLYRLNLQWHLLPQSSSAFGIYIGSTVHEVAQVVAVGKSIGHDAADTAVIAKMVRVMMLAPFLIGLSAWIGRARNCVVSQDVAHDKTKLAIPWFAFAFIAVVGLNSLSMVNSAVIAHIDDLDTLTLAMAMAALGLTTHVSAVRRAGIKPLLLAGVLFVWLIAGGAAINRLVPVLFA
jgi:uncharacterized integral membrane protein (TIGR00698 family)